MNFSRPVFSLFSPDDCVVTVEMPWIYFRSQGNSDDDSTAGER